MFYYNKFNKPIKVFKFVFNDCLFSQVFHSNLSNRLAIQLKIMNNFQANQAYTFLLLFWTCILTLILITFSCSFIFRFCSFFFHCFCPDIYFIQLKFKLKTRSIQAMAELRRQYAKTDNNHNFNLQIKSSVYVD